GRGLHLRRATQGAARAALDALLPAAQPQRRVLGRLDVEGRGDVRDREGRLPGGTYPLDHRAGRGWRPVARGRPEATRDATPGHPLPGATSIHLLADVTPFRFPS